MVEEAKYKLVGLTKEKSALQMGAQHDIPCLIIGETGIGKTYVLYHIAEEAGKRVVRVNLNGEIGVNELLGKWLIRDGDTVWQDGILTECMRKGYWIILDELNSALPEVLFCLNSLLDSGKSIVLTEKDGEEVKPHKEFRLFATMNPVEEYSGTKDLNKALLSRFAITVRMGYYSPAMERTILMTHTSTDKVIAGIMVDIGNTIRKLKALNLISYTCSTRDLLSWATIYTANGHSLEETFELAVLNKAHLDEHAVIIDKVNKLATDLKIDLKSMSKDMEAQLSAKLTVALDEIESRKEALQRILGTLHQNIESAKEEVTNG